MVRRTAVQVLSASRVRHEPFLFIFLLLVACLRHSSSRSHVLRQVHSWNFPVFGTIIFITKSACQLVSWVQSSLIWRACSQKMRTVPTFTWPRSAKQGLFMSSSGLTSIVNVCVLLHAKVLLHWRHRLEIVYKDVMITPASSVPSRLRTSVTECRIFSLRLLYNKRRSWCLTKFYG